MSVFDLGRTVEEQGFAALVPFLRTVAFNGQFVLTTAGPMSRLLQETLGDVLLNRGGKVYGIEVKTEKTNAYGNFFFETWSNKNFEPRRPGWIYTSIADMFWYYFIEQDELYTIDARKLFKWAHENPSVYVPGGVGRMYDFPEKAQSKYEQRNNTCGRCVPISVIRDEVGLHLYRPVTSRNQTFFNFVPPEDSSDGLPAL